MAGLTSELDQLKAQLAESESAHKAKVTEHIDLSSRVEEQKQLLETRVAGLEETLAQHETNLAAAQEKLTAGDAAGAQARKEAVQAGAAAEAAHASEVEALKGPLADLKGASQAQAQRIEDLTAELEQARKSFLATSLPVDHGLALEYGEMSVSSSSGGLVLPAGTWAWAARG